MYVNHCPNQRIMVYNINITLLQVGIADGKKERFDDVIISCVGH
jgi:predicted NAD/FAD-binding protein